MNKSRIARGALYVLIGITFTPLVLLPEHPIMCGIQAAALVFCGAGLMVLGARQKRE